MKKLLLTILPLFIVLASCSKDGKGIDDGDKEPGKVEAKELNLSFDVVMPNPANPNSNQKSSSSYALVEKDENAVAVIDVLAFLENGANMEFAEWAKVAGGAISDNGSVSKKKFKANFTKLIQSPAHKYQFVVIANGRGPVQGLFTGASAITTGALKDAVMKRLKLEDVEGWVSETDGNGYLHMPMWGEGNKTVVTTGLVLSDIKLLRMLAKINVTIDGTTGVRDKFLLKSVDLYNYNKDGRIVPDVRNLVTLSKVKEPTNIGVHTEGPIKYLATSATEMVEEIYTFESKVPYVGLPAAVNLDNVICIVIGGEFETDGKTTYYRVDLAKKNAQGKYDYMNILRNHGYNINVTNVAGSGHESSIKAFKARAVNIEVDIEAWDESDVVVDYDGQYQFGTNKNKLFFFAEGREQTLLVFADHPSGWEIETATKPSWITIDPMSDNSASTKEIKVTATAWAGPGSREAKFIIKAGNLRKPITVEQTSDAELSIEVNPAAITFNKSAAQKKPIIVKTFPEILTRTITVSGDIEWMSGFSPVDASGYSWETFAIQPKPNTTGTTLSSTITISITHNSTTLTRAVTVDQRHDDITFEVFKPATYSATGGDVEFGVQSGVPWQLSVDGAAISDPGNIITLLTTEEQPESPHTSVSYKFNLAQNTSYGERVASFYAKSSDLDFPSQMVEIKQGFKPLYLNLGNNVVNFGVTSAAQSVTVTTNAGWVVSSVSNTDVLNATSPTMPVVDQVQTGSVSALVDATGTISLTPKTDYVTFGAAGTPLSSVVTVQSRNHAEVATPISATISVTRTVPSVFSVASITPTSVPRAAGIVTANTVASNATWTLSSNLAGTTPSTHYAAEYNTTDKTIAIPANNTWANPRSFEVSVASANHPTKSITVTQPGYTFAYSSGFPTTTIPLAGGTYDVIFKSTTASPIVYVRTVINGTSTIVSASQQVPAITAVNGTHKVSMVIPVAWAGNRVVALQWSTNNSAWVNFSPTNITQTQLGYTAPAAAGYTVYPTLHSSISYVGLPYKIEATSTGQYPAINVQILVNGDVHKTGIIPAGNNTKTSTTLTLDANSSEATRTVVVQYQNPQTKGWINFTSGSGTQLKGVGIYIPETNIWVMYPRHLVNTSLMNLTEAVQFCTSLDGGNKGWQVVPSMAEYSLIINNINFKNAYNPVLRNLSPNGGSLWHLFWSIEAYDDAGSQICAMSWNINTQVYSAGRWWVNRSGREARPICINRYL